MQRAQTDDERSRRHCERDGPCTRTRGHPKRQEEERNSYPKKDSAKKTSKNKKNAAILTKLSAKTATPEKISAKIDTPEKPSVKKADKVATDTKLYVDTIHYTSDYGDIDVGHYGYHDTVKNVMSRSAHAARRVANNAGVLGEDGLTLVTACSAYVKATYLKFSWRGHLVIQFSINSGLHPQRHL